jgi:broad specificity phosphatase PhoE
MDAHQSVTTRLLLIRHGQTELSRDDVFCGATEASLTAQGQEQAQLIAKRLEQERIDVLYCSPQERALATAAPIASVQNLEIHQRDGLREMNFGLWEGRTRRELLLVYPREFLAWEHGSWMVQLPGGETLQEVIARVVPCVMEVLAHNAGRTVAFVGHKSTLRLLIGHMLDMSLAASRNLHLDPASLTELHIMGERTQLILYNDTRHLVSQTKNILQTAHEVR